MIFCLFSFLSFLSCLELVGNELRWFLWVRDFVWCLNSEGFVEWKLLIIEGFEGLGFGVGEGLVGRRGLEWWWKYIGRFGGCLEFCECDEGGVRIFGG